MKAARIDTFGPPERLVIADIPTPAIRAGDVLVRVVASGFNPIELKIRSGMMGPALGRALPATLGWECAGTVEAVGSTVTDFAVGDSVCAYTEFGRDGTHAEFVAIDASQLARKPASLTFEQAAAVPMTAQAAWTVLELAGELSGRRVLIHGAGGAVGHWLVQLASQRGALVTGTASGDGIHALLALGVTEAIDYRLQRFEDAGEFDVVLDLVGGPTQTKSWGILTRGGRLVSTASSPDQALAAARGATGQFAFTQPRGAVLAQIFASIDAGQLRSLPVGAVRPLADAAAVHAGFEAGITTGKVVLSVQP